MLIVIPTGLLNFLMNTFTKRSFLLEELWSSKITVIQPYWATGWPSIISSIPEKTVFGFSLNSAVITLLPNFPELVHPKISIVIPSFNQGNYIERTLLSILKQNYSGEVEIIVSDGGSTDNTIEILKKYQSKIKWWSEKDNGFADAVNKGFQNATGEIFAIQSSDDYYLSGAFQKLIFTFNKHVDAVLICGREALQEPNGNIFGGYELPDIISPKSFLLDHPFPGIFQHTTFFHRKYYEMAGGLRSQFDMCADTDVFYRMLHFGPGVFLNEYVAVYQRHAAQRTLIKLKQFEGQLLDLPINCRNDPFYNNLYPLTDKEYNLFSTFITLFYLQFTNFDMAVAKATEVINNPENDERSKKLANQLITSRKLIPEFKDNLLKKTFRIPKNIINKYILRRKNRIHQIPFSIEADSNWWKD